MKGRIGCPTRIITAVPHQRELAKGEGKELSKKAKDRLKIFDWYYQSSARYSLSGIPEVKVTCKHFGIHRSYFYRWKNRYDKTRLSSLENKPTVPKRKREPCYSRALVDAVRDIRKKDPTYSGEKIKTILERTITDVPSISTLGRLINRENLFFRADVKRHRKRSRTARKAHERIRKPYDLKADGARKIIEFDMKHIYLLGSKQYAFCAIDPFTKEAAIHIASSPSSLNAKTALEKVIARWGKDIKIVNDNGSENMGKVEEYLKSLEIAQYWAHPHAPKEKPFIERFIGTLQRECLDYNYAPMNVTEMREAVDKWLDKYHFYRPHASLKSLTPAEYSAKLGVPIQNSA